MAPTCITCGATTDLMALHERGFGPTHQGIPVPLCQGCLEDREAKLWPAGDRETGILRSALEARHAPPLGRFTYVEDDGGALHLLRLRPDFVDDRAVGQLLGEA